MYLSLSGLNQMTDTNITQILTKEEISQKKKAEKMKGRSLVHYKWSVFLPLVLILSVWCHNITTEYAASLTVSGRGRKIFAGLVLSMTFYLLFFLKCYSLAHKLCTGYSFTKVCHYSTNLHFPHYHYQIHITSPKKSCRNNEIMLSTTAWSWWWTRRHNQHFSLSFFKNLVDYNVEESQWCRAGVLILKSQS